MPQSEQFSKTWEDILLDLLQVNQQNSFFQRFFYGDPENIPTSAMPFCGVFPGTTKNGMRPGPTGMDEITKTIHLRLIANVKDFIGGDPDSQAGWKDMQLWIEGIDQTTGTYDTRTIFSIIRTNFTLQNSLTDQSINVEYYKNKRSSSDTVEAFITFTATGLQNVGVRS